MSNLTYTNITDPSNGNIYSIFSNSGKKLLKSYIQVLNQSNKTQIGGAAAAESSVDNIVYNAKQEEINELLESSIHEPTYALRGYTNHFIMSNPNITGLSEEQMQNINTLPRNQLIIAFINIKLQEYDEFNALTPYEINNILERLNE